jgi:serine/threonine protein kinase
MIGRTLSHYKIVEEIGHGGMGVVYRALDTRLGREVALKVLGPELCNDPELERRLRQEAHAAASLAHPAISVVYEISRPCSRAAGWSRPVPSSWPSRWRKGSRKPTSGGSCTATSSPRT